MKICVHLYFVLSILLGIRNVLDKSCRENQNTHFIVQFFSPENRASMRCGKIRYSQRQQMTIRCMRTVCLITKAARARTHTHTHTHTKNTLYLLLFHGNNGYAHVPQFYVYTYNTCHYSRLHKINFLKFVNSSLQTSITLNHGLNSKTWRFVRNVLAA